MKIPMANKESNDPPCAFYKLSSSAPVRLQVYVQTTRLPVWKLKESIHSIPLDQKFAKNFSQCVSLLSLSLSLSPLSLSLSNGLLVQTS